ncbi:hypothetical protein HAZT_HAZT001912 [Hyalella azteca]|uniref:DOMON domain-containing protein n=1 Tax=Hyalella azteca TaxID=294128 RepID=A0A6A0GXG5_HYAAZ|nr:hypothetical protein HAZT_HAZT001912 [Hyalella azteca]
MLALCCTVATALSTGHHPDADDDVLHRHVRDEGTSHHPDMDVHEPLIHSVQLDDEGRYVLSWTPLDDDVIFEVQVAALGYVGLGFSPTGGMTGADIILGWVTEDGNVTLTDRYAKGDGSPLLDASQDVTLMSGRRNATHTTMRFSRPWVTCDDLHDLPITADTVRVIYAFDDEIPDASAPNLPYHDHRGTKSLYLKEAPVEMPPASGDVLHWEVLAPNVSLVHLPNNLTTLYWCKLFRMPELRTKHHFIASEPVISKVNKQYVHHMLFYECHIDDSSSRLQRYVDQPGVQCYGPDMPLSWYRCGRPLVAWGTGGEGEALPPHVGTPLGEEWNGATYFMLEIHYNNPTMTPDVIDSSGLRLFYTSTLRQHDSGTLELGLPPRPTLIVPPQSAEFRAVGHCSPACTSQALPAGGLQVLAGILHAHLLGRAVTLRHIRDGKELPPILADHHYDFNYQQKRQLAKEVTILPGDHLIVTCSYDSTHRLQPTFVKTCLLYSINTKNGGLSTNEEMCLVYLTVYPRPALSKCQSEPDMPAVFHSVGVESFYPETGGTKMSLPNRALGAGSQEERMKNMAAMEEAQYRKMVASKNTDMHVNDIIFYQLWNETIIKEPYALQNMTFLQLLNERNLWQDPKILADFQRASSDSTFVQEFCLDSKMKQLAVRKL